jgi:hypothetical protein
VQAIAAVARELSGMERPFPLAIAGGLLLASDRYRGSVLDAVRGAGLAPDPVTMVDDPAEGALQLAFNEMIGEIQSNRDRLQFPGKL